MNPKTLEKRWKNALKIAGKVNHLLSKGFVILDENRDVVEYPFVIREFSDNTKSLVRRLSENGYELVFVKNPDLDNGALDSMKKFSARFDKWRVYNPTAFWKL